MARRRLAVGLVVVSGIAIAGGVAPAAAQGGAAMRMDVVASGLNNPRGLSFGPRDRLYVAEAGLGGGNETVGVLAGIGLNSSVTEIQRPGSSNPVQARVVTGLPSGAQSEGGGPPEAVGADGISVSGNGASTSIYTIIGASGVPNTNLGHLMRSSLDGTSTPLADVGAADLAWSGTYKDEPWAPTYGPNVPQFPDSNPYGVTVVGGHTYVVDAGSNTLDEVMSDGSVKILAYFPDPAISDSTPTCVTQGPDGALYIGTLALAAFFNHMPGAATVYRVDPSAAAGDLNSILSVAKVWATGFNTITGCTFGPHGDFYATEMFTGDVVRVPFAHPATGRTYIGRGQLQLPNGVAVGRDGAVYVSNKSDSTAAGSGEVVRFRTGGTTGE